MISLKSSLPVTGILLLSLGVLFVPAPSGALWFQVASNAGHAVVFGLVSILLLLWMRPSTGKSSRAAQFQYVATLGVAFLLGAATEIIQIPLERDASWLDMATDVLGALVGLGAFALFDNRLSRRTRVALTIAAVIALTVISRPIAICFEAYQVRRTTFPTLADYSESFNDYFLIPHSVSLRHVPLPNVWADEDNERALQISFERSRWPGIEFIEPASNWQGFTNLALDLTNPNQSALKINVRVHDQAHNSEFSDRYNAEIEIPPGVRLIQRLPLEQIREAPSNRVLDIERVSGLMVFGDGTEVTGKDLLLSRIWLE